MADEHIKLEDSDYFKDQARLAMMMLDTAANYTSNNPTLAARQIGYETDTKKFKIGDGATAWNSLSYFGVGKQTVWIPAASMTPATTSGCAALSQVESATNKINYGVLNFDGSSAEYAHFNVAFPKSWDKGTITFIVIWQTTNSGTAGVAWGLQGVAVSDGETIDAAFGFAVYVVDNAQSSAAKQYVSGESSAVTIAGTPANGDIVYFRISRDPSNGSDNMTEDASLVGIHLFYTTNALNDA